MMEDKGLARFKAREYAVNARAINWRLREMRSTLPRPLPGESS